MEKKIRMIAADLDGTALNREKHFSPLTVKTFKLAVEKGIHVVISTGRPYSALPEDVFALDGLEYVINSNGASVTKLPDERIYSSFLNPNVVEKIISFLRENNCRIEVFTGGKAYDDKKMHEQVLRDRPVWCNADYLKKTRIPVRDIFDFAVKNKEALENINIIFPDPEERVRIAEILKRCEEITLTSSYAENLEIGGKETSKANALRFLMAKFGIERNELLAFGDNMNDLEMLKLAGIGVAMGNGEEKLKEQADRVTESNEEDGVAKMIIKSCL